MGIRKWRTEKNGEALCDRPRPFKGCSAEEEGRIIIIAISSEK